jgi:hypothetical protein
MHAIKLQIEQGQSVQDAGDASLREVQPERSR